MIEKFCQFGDQDTNDDGFESEGEEEVMAEDEDATGGQGAIDLDKLKDFGWTLLTQG